MTVDYKKLLRDAIRGAIVDWDDVPVPVGKTLNPAEVAATPADEEADFDIEPLTDEEVEAYVDLVREVQAEYQAAGMSPRIDIERILENA